MYLTEIQRGMRTNWGGTIRLCSLITTKEKHCKTVLKKIIFTSLIKQSNIKPERDKKKKQKQNKQNKWHESIPLVGEKRDGIVSLRFLSIRNG